MDDGDVWTALQQLTRPRTEDTPQRNAAGIVCVLTHPPLLDDLDAAAVGASGSHAGTVAAGLDSTRLPGNWAAIALRDEIRKIAGGSTTAALRDWVHQQHAAYLAGRSTDRTWHGTTARVQGWAARIRAIFDPPTTVPLDVLCPICGNRWGQEPTHGDRVDAIAVMYSRDEQDTIRKVWAECRNRDCGWVWDGREGIRSLVDAAHVRARIGVNPYTATPEELADAVVYAAA